MTSLKNNRTAGGNRGHNVAADKLDLKLLTILLNDGRASLRQMARELHVSTTTVAHRVSGLEKSGIIGGYSVTVNTEKLGYDLTAVTQILVSRGKLSEMEREIAKLPGVCAVYDVTGEKDAIVIAKFRNRRELGRYTKGLLSMPFVERTVTHVVLETVREDFRLL